jgi:hypothetical protein
MIQFVNNYKSYCNILEMICNCVGANHYLFKSNFLHWLIIRLFLILSKNMVYLITLISYAKICRMNLILNCQNLVPLKVQSSQISH